MLKFRVADLLPSAPPKSKFVGMELVESQQRIIAVVAVDTGHILALDLQVRVIAWHACC